MVFKLLATRAQMKANTSHLYKFTFQVPSPNADVSCRSYPYLYSSITLSVHPKPSVHGYILSTVYLDTIVQGCTSGLFYCPFKKGDIEGTCEVNVS